MSMWSLKMLQYINCRVRVTTQGGHQLIGKLLAIHRNTNLVLGDCEEFRTLPPTEGSEEEREVRRTIGLVLLRRGQVFSLIVEGPPPPDDNRLGTTAIPGPGLVSAAGRCVATSQLAQAQPGLVGGPSPGMMQPPSPMMRGGPPRPGMPGPPRQQPPRPGMMPPPRQGMPPPPRQGMPHPPPGMRQGQDCQV